MTTVCLNRPTIMFCNCTCNKEMINRREGEEEKEEQKRKREETEERGKMKEERRESE